jgi:large subunit ribosomal protein L15
MSGELSKLTPAKGANRPRKVKGRGIGTGLGKTSGRGMKGQKARKSGHVRVGFEGGQMPIQRRIPKRGFKSLFGFTWAEVKVTDLNRFPAGTVVDAAALKTEGLAKRRADGVKIIGIGELKVRVDVKVNRITAGARGVIEKKGGKVELIADRAPWKRPDSRKAKRVSKQKSV